MRLSSKAALDLFGLPLNELQKLAHGKRCRILPEPKAAYVIMRIVSYTNICVADCKYCAFYRPPSHPEGYVLGQEEIFQKIDALVSKGGSLVAMEGGFNPNLKIEHYESLFHSVRNRYGSTIEIYGPTSVEVLFIARNSKISLEEALCRLKKSGLCWIPGGGAEILTPEWRRKLSPKKYSVDQYFEAMAIAQRLGFGTTATMVIGFGEDPNARIEHLERVRLLQDQTGGFRSFLIWTYQPDHTELGGVRTSDEDYLRTVAVSRLYLDNIPHIRTSLLTQGEAGAQALWYGADDFDIALEDEVTEKAGAKIESNIQTVLGWVEAAGLKPVMRRPYPIGS